MECIALPQWDGMYCPAPMGWNVLPCPNGMERIVLPQGNDYGTPFLKDMYQDVYRIYDAQLYAFSNGDILYDTGLVQTLNSTIAFLIELNTTMIVGRRWNYPVNQNYSVYINNSLWKSDKVKKLTNSQTSELFWTDVQDIFFVTKSFPWKEIADVVIG